MKKLLAKIWLCLLALIILGVISYACYIDHAVLLSVVVILVGSLTLIAIEVLNE